MDAPLEDDVPLLEDEKFDFDISLSSSSANEDDDEVFLGPVGHKEGGIAARVEPKQQAAEEPPPPGPGDSWAWKPLEGDTFVEVYKEAHLLALQIESARKAASTPPAQPCSQAGEHFVQESQSKISLFEKEKEAKRKPQLLKRETFCVGDGASPLPLPASPAPARPAVLLGPTPSQPLSQNAVQKRAGRLLPRAPSHRHAALEKADEPHSANGHPQPLKEPPANPSQPVEPQREKELPRDLRSHRPITAGDGTSLQASGTHLGPGKRSLPVPHKGLRKTQLKTPCGARSSHAAAGQGTKPSECPPGPADDGQPQAAPGRARQPVPLGPSWPSQGAAELAAGPPRTPTPAAPRPRMSEPAARAPAPRRSLSCSSQAPRTVGARRRESSLGPRTGPPCTLAEPFKVPRSPAREPPGSATPKFPRALRPQPHTPAGSTPAPCSARTPSAPRRLSSLPTPASRRLSSLPRVTPRSTCRAPASPPSASVQRPSSEPRSKGALRTALAWKSSGHAASSSSDESPGGGLSPLAAVPQALHFSPEQGERLKSVSPEEAPEGLQPSSDPSLPEALLVDIGLDQLTITPKVESAPCPVEVPLIDFCGTPEASVALRGDNRPLIDLLVNTPEWAWSNTPKPKPGHEAVQLIDLTSPLIQLSPEADKENVASPLLKF